RLETGHEPIRYPLRGSIRSTVRVNLYPALNTEILTLPTAGMAFPEFAQTDRPMWRENPSNLLRPDRIQASAKAVQSAVCTINPNLL
ncbi:hypothetical protein, partial [Ralstonia solanacearum]|uniref:hypothetical protein n=1 Tax=Ralstonia solanacearum TaxID=305 RepID=UPI002306134F